MTDTATVTLRLYDGKGGQAEFSPLTADQLKRAVEKVRSKAGKAPLKPDLEFDKMKDTAFRVTADELRQFIERFERLEAEKKDIADQQKEVMAEAKGRGYDTKALRKVIADRKKDPNQLAEEEAVADLYREALGM